MTSVLPNLNLKNPNVTSMNQCKCKDPNYKGGATGGTCGSPAYKGDGNCDDDNNNPGCNFDGGDCCGPNVKKTYCKICACLQK